LVLSLALIAFGEAITMSLWDPTSAGAEPLWVNLTFAPRFAEGLFIPYPFVHWLAMMMLGWVFGERLVEAPKDGWSPERILWVGGLLALATFALVRGLDGYGNMHLYREDGSIVQWLHVSKYPPALAFTALELGIMSLCLAGLMRLEPRVAVRDWGPILVYGQTALFFYILHFLMLGASKTFVETGGLGHAYLGAAVVLVILYPICRAFRALKRKHPTSVLRFI
jgi:uncharacterized membrane protein